MVSSSLRGPSWRPQVGHPHWAESSPPGAERHRYDAAAVVRKKGKRASKRGWASTHSFEPPTSSFLGAPTRPSDHRGLIRSSRYGPSPMRLIVARCEVTYSGRINAVLPEALRLLM